MRDLKIWMLGCGVWAMVLVSGNLPTLAAEDNPGAVATPAPTMVVTEATPTATPTPGPSAKKFEFYGFVRTDVIWENSTMNDADLPFSYVPPETGNNGEFALHARQTRFGAWFRGGKVGSADALGRFEFDLTGGGRDIRYTPTIRHAYFELDWERFSLVAGHTWEVVSPLSANTVQHLPLIMGGNIGYRKPQIYTTYKQPIGTAFLQMQLGIARNIESFASMAGDPADPGETYPAPQVQARIGLHGKLGDRSAQIGVSGHYSREDYGQPLGKFHSYSVNGDAVLPIAGWLELKGEIFYGANLDSIYGGVGQGVNTTLGTAIVSHGGWGQLCVTPVTRLQLNAGGGIDNPNDGDLSPGMRSYSATGFGNVFFWVTKAFQIGLEYTYFRTGYIGGATADNHRIQTALIYYVD